MNKAMSPGELAPGQYVTVLANKPSETVSEDLLGTTKVVTQTHHTDEGTIFKVLSVDLPFVALQYQNSVKIKIIRDTRRVTFMELSNEFVRVFIDNP